MKKYIILFILCFFVLPLNAQRVIKYVSFYPVPYGSHDTDVYVLDPEEYYNQGMLSDNINPGDIQGESNKSNSAAVLNASNGSRTDISGDFILPENQSDGKSSFKAKTLKINQNSGTNTFGDTKPNIVAGSQGLHLITGNTFFSNTAEILGSAGGIITPNFKAESTEVTANASATDRLSQSFKNIANGCDCSGIPNCAYVRGWQQIRIKGSEECKQFLVCSYNTYNTDNSCKDPATVCHESGAKKCYTSTGKCLSMPNPPGKLNGKSLNQCTYSNNGNTYQWTCPCSIYANGTSDERSETFGNIIATLICTDYKGWGNMSFSWNCSCGEQHDYYWSETQKRCIRRTYSWHCDNIQRSFWESDCQNTHIPYPNASCSSSQEGDIERYSSWDENAHECEYASCRCTADN